MLVPVPSPAACLAISKSTPWTIEKYSRKVLGETPLLVLESAIVSAILIKKHTSVAKLTVGHVCSGMPVIAMLFRADAVSCFVHCCVTSAA